MSILDALATGSVTFAEGLINQISNAARTGSQVTPRELNFMLATIHQIAPRDPTEALLATQMAAIHNATMIAARRLNHVDTILQQDSASNMLNKLARTFAAQVETLKKYRSSGEQSIKVEHITVADGGQAVIGNVQSGGGVPQKTGDQPHEPSRTGQSRPALLGNEQADRVPMPGASHEGLERLPVPRGPGRSTEGAG